MTLIIHIIIIIISTSLEAAQAGRLILYKPNTYLPLSPPLSPTRKEEDSYEPMEID